MEEEKKDLKKIKEAELIWSEISGLPINMFALSGQKVEDHVEKVAATGNKLLLKPKSSAVLVFLEESVGSKYVLETTDNGHIFVSRAES